ncbi:MAG: peptidoglycan DD-metalloendopeptidase family protein [Gammaproteobacteria bacterium]|nr:peptidoglycan DD-metalloendopeptidase family protein [Gammaproteobacteria bacterium]
MKLDLTETQMYKALVEKDEAFEGIFFAAVKTTGIFCRPTCRARKPKRENVEYFKTAKEALLGGYRPCKVCTPISPKGEAPEWVGKTLNEAKLHAEKSLDAMAGRLSLLQGHVMRLDALGSRMAKMADLKDLDFGVENPPGMGGPVSSLEQQSINVPDFLTALDKLEIKINDRSEKLTAIESMLINRSLQEQTLPDGRPALGGWISSLFGYRTDPMTGKREIHEGMDFAGKPGTPIMAVAAGIITWSGPRYGYGNLVEISHGSGYITRYAHNQKNLVAVGEKVVKAEVIAIMGSSGRSTGTHVHIEVLRNGKHVNPSHYIALQ